MTREEKCLLAIKKGFTYNQETGTIYGPTGKEITCKLKDGYINIQLYLNDKKYNLSGHQFAWYYINNECVKQIDHINGVRDDNRISNLRNVTHQQNQHNRTTAKGYTWNKKRNKWQGKIVLNSKNIYLGLFDKEEDARAAYLKAKEKYHII